MKAICKLGGAALSALLLFSCVSFYPDPRQAKGKVPALRMDSYAFNPETSVLSRVQPPPGFVLDYLRKYDNKDDYTAYAPSDKEMRMIGQYLEKLPELYKSALRKRVLGIYFVNNFMGSGFTEYVPDKNGNIYCIMVFNPQVLKKDISSWLTEKENTCFVPDASGRHLSIDCGKKHSGFLWVLLHEATHVVDYVVHITPYVEKGVLSVPGEKPYESAFIKNVWYEYDVYAPGVVFPYQKDVSFYGFGGGAKLKAGQSVDVYRALAGTPFASLYATSNWAEDAADYMAFYILVRKMGLPYVIRVQEAGKTLFEYEPMDSNIVRERFDVAKVIAG